MNIAGSLLLDRDLDNRKDDSNNEHEGEHAGESNSGIHEIIARLFIYMLFWMINAFHHSNPLIRYAVQHYGCSSYPLVYPIR